MTLIQPSSWLSMLPQSQMVEKRVAPHIVGGIYDAGKMVV